VCVCVCVCARAYFKPRTTQKWMQIQHDHMAQSPIYFTSIA